MRLTRHRTGSPHSGHPGGRAVGRLGTRSAPSDSAWPASPRCHAPLLQELREACTGQETPDGLASCGWGGQQHDLDSCRAAIYNSILLSSSRNVTHTYSLDWDMLLLHHTLTHSLVGGKASPGTPSAPLPHTQGSLSHRPEPLTSWLAPPHRASQRNECKRQTALGTETAADRRAGWWPHTEQRG